MPSENRIRAPSVAGHQVWTYPKRAHMIAFTSDGFTIVTWLSWLLYYPSPLLPTFDALRTPRIARRNDIVQDATTNKYRYMLIPVNINYYTELDQQMSKSTVQCFMNSLHCSFSNNVLQHFGRWLFSMSEIANSSLSLFRILHTWIVFRSHLRTNHYIFEGEGAGQFAKAWNLFLFAFA